MSAPRGSAPRGPVKLWNLARHVYHEALYQGSLSAAGSSAQRLTEKMSNDSRYISRQARMVQILGSVYLLFVTVLPVSAMRELVTGSTHQWNLFVTSIAGTIHMLVQTGYLMILTLVATSEILASDLYRWPESLPLRNEQAGMLRVMALAREFLLPLAVIVLSYPVAAAVSGGIVVAIATLAVSTTHAVFTVSITVLASWRLRRALRSASGGDRRSNVIRILTMASYGVGMLLVLAIMQFGTGFVVSLLDQPRIPANLSLRLLQIASLVPLPTAPAILVSGLVASHAALDVSLPVWFPLIGTVLYGAMTFGLLRAAWRWIGAREGDEGTAASGRFRERDQIRPAAGLRVRPPRVAFRRQIFLTATRDTQVLLALIFPLIIPLAIVAGPVISGAPTTALSYAQPVVAAVLSGWYLVLGLTRLQGSTGRLEASLPVIERDRAFPRLTLCAIIPSVGAVIAALALMPPDLKLQGFLLGTAPAVTVPVGFLVKTSLFGRVKGSRSRVVVDEVFVSHRFLKWLAAVATVMVATAGLVAVWVVLGQLAAGLARYAAYAVITLAAGLVVRFAAGRVFPASGA